MTEKEAAARAAGATRAWFDPSGSGAYPERWVGSLEDWFLRHWQRFPSTRPRNLTAEPAPALDAPTIDLDPPTTARGSWKWDGIVWGEWEKKKGTLR